MPRKLKLSPLQGAILQMLEEAGSEEISTIIATFDSEPTKRIEEALQHLSHIDLVFFVRAGDATQRDGALQTDETIAELPSLRSIHESPNNLRIEVVLSERGSSALVT